MARKYLVTEDEFLSAKVTENGDLEFTRDNGEKVYAGSVKGDPGEQGEPGQDGANVLPTDEAIGQAINTAGSAAELAVTQRVTDGVPGIVTPMIEDKVSSPVFRTMIRTSDPEAVASAPADTFVAFEGVPGIRSDFPFGMEEAFPVWASDVSEWTHTDGTVLSHTGASNNAYGLVLRQVSGALRDADMVVRTRYRGTLTTGLKCVLFARGTGETAERNAVYTGIQSTSNGDGDAGAGLRLNAWVGGSNAVTGPSSQTAKNAAFRNQIDTWYYLRLRVISGLAMSKQWLASDSEPAAWDLAVLPENLPSVLRPTGESGAGMFGFMASHAQPQDFDYFAIAFDGASAPLKETT